ncbi:hypothetical protein A2U01_0096348, partial [Trifolium medium]|nr:hypothetical protein [Trifolium medium]
GFVRALVAFLCSGHIRFNGDRSAFVVVVLHLQVHRGGNRAECYQGWASQNTVVWQFARNH